MGEKERQRKSKNREIDMSVRNMGQKEEREGDRRREGGKERKREREAGNQRTGRWRDRHVGKKYGT